MSPARSVAHLRDYVAIPSVNPMGRDDIPESVSGETRYAEHLREQLRSLGVDAELIGDATRRSVVAEVRAPNTAETILVASHLDTVPVDGMEIPPFDPQISSGQLYGRGSCDTKGGMAAAVAALERVLRRGRLRRNIILVGEADEELGSRGVHDVLQHLGTRAPSWVLATEPTGMKLVTHHKGVALARLEAHGRACHSSQPGAGSNAIVALARAVLALEKLAHELDARRDPRLGAATLSIGLAGGGRAPNMVPDEAWLVSDRRMLPGESAEQVQQEIETALREAGVDDVRVASCRTEKGPLGTDDSHPSVAACQRALAHCHLPIETASVAFGTDAGAFAQHGWPGVVLGPGSIDLAHTSRESVPTSEVEAMEEFFVALFQGD